MNEKRSEKNYKALALLPLIIFLALYVGCGVVFKILGADYPVLLLLFTCITIQAGLLRTQEEKDAVLECHDKVQES